VKRLETERLVLRDLGPGDVDALLAIQGDPEVMRFYPSTHDRAATERSLAGLEARARAHGHTMWAAVEKATGRVVGQIGVLPQLVDGRHETEVGYLFRRDAWGRGLATEAARACRDLAFDALGAPRVISLILPENAPSRRVAERNEMRVLGETLRLGRRTLVYGVERGDARTPADARWVRPERGGDAGAIRALHEDAFAGSDFEPRIVDRSRALPGPRLSLVAVDSGRIAGHVLLTPVTIEGDAARAPLFLGLGPLGVATACQRRGLGGWLVRAALERAPGLGAAAVFLLGHPGYYPRFGFTPARHRGLAYEGARLADAFQGIELAPGALGGRTGFVRYGPAFAAG
jgi:predicted N-acetyltransferase YhbS/RimJ/RimL family protein N-acetyltransferase